MKTLSLIGVNILKVCCCGEQKDGNHKKKLTEIVGFDKPGQIFEFQMNAELLLIHIVILTVLFVLLKVMAMKTMMMAVTTMMIMMFMMVLMILVMMKDKTRILQWVIIRNHQ